MTFPSKQTLNWFWVQTQSFGLSVKTTLNSGPCTHCGKPNGCTGAVMHTKIYSPIFANHECNLFLSQSIACSILKPWCGPKSICLIWRCGGLQSLICHSHWPLALSHSRKGHISIFLFMAVMRFRVTLPPPALCSEYNHNHRCRYIFFPQPSFIWL